MQYSPAQIGLMNLAEVSNVFDQRQQNLQVLFSEIMQHRDDSLFLQNLDQALDKAKE
jgi:hypothetical protein